MENKNKLLFLILLVLSLGLIVFDWHLTKHDPLALDFTIVENTIKKEGINYHIHGNATNISQYTLNNTIIFLKLFNSDNKYVTTVFTYPHNNLLKSGQNS